MPYISIQWNNTSRELLSLIKSFWPVAVDTSTAVNSVMVTVRLYLNMSIMATTNPC